jgi:diguanylate cyclase (GGDEF)-like protein
MVSSISTTHDGFKHINDRFGHLQGNRTLRAIAGALKTGRRENEYIARMGGDEFVIISPDCSEALIQQKHSRFSEIVAAAAREISPHAPLSVSMGAARYPDDGHEAEQLLAEADRRMYINKQSNKSSLVGESAGGARWSRAYTRTTEQVPSQEYKH